MSRARTLLTVPRPPEGTPVPPAPGKLTLTVNPLHERTDNTSRMYAKTDIPPGRLLVPSTFCPKDDEGELARFTDVE